MARHGTDAKTCGMMNDEQPSRMFMDVLLDVLDCFRGIYIFSGILDFLAESSVISVANFKESSVFDPAWHGAGWSYLGECLLVHGSGSPMNHLRCEITSWMVDGRKIRL